MLRVRRSKRAAPPLLVEARHALRVLPAPRYAGESVGVRGLFRRESERPFAKDPSPQPSPPITGEKGGKARLLASAKRTHRGRCECSAVFPDVPRCSQMFRKCSRQNEPTECPFLLGEARFSGPFLVHGFTSVNTR